MNYKLAQELKDAGFPYKEDGLYQRIDNPEGEGRVAAVPLGELIEACPRLVLTKLTDSYHVCNCVELDYINNQTNIEAKTPEEAVAKLWLALNKKEPRCLCGQDVCPMCKGALPQQQ